MMNRALRVSVIIPVYNGARTIASCLESVLGQTYPADAYDVIVVENGSTDETSAIAERYPIRLFHSDKRGPAAARNLGLAQSDADVVAFTDADCVADAQWLSELVKPYADPEVGGVGGAILAYDHHSHTIAETFSEEHSPLVNFVSGEREFLPHLYTANASYRRSLLVETGAFDPRLVTAEDVDLAWRLQLQTGTGVYYSPQAIVYHYHRSTPAGLARQYRQYGFGEILLDTMYGKYPGYPRGRAHQIQRILSQIAALPRYAVSALLRQARLITGGATPYQAAVPRLWLRIESSNILGKIEGLAATRFMTTAQPALDMRAEELITRYFPSRKK
jgi:glycosyltransferase involved in cell wall biosynthesis